MTVPTRLGGVTIQKGVSMSMRDGCVLVADIYRPEGVDRPLPVMVMRTPYNRKVGTETNFAHPAWYARQGFIVVVQDTRGRFDSEGEFTPFVSEAQDGYDTIQWAATLPGSNGRVGTYGDSYLGYSQLLTASTQPPALHAICPGTAGSTLANGWIYENGLLSLAFLTWWTAALGIDVAARRKDLELEDRLLEVLGGPMPWYQSASPYDLQPIAEAIPFYRDWLDRPPEDVSWLQLSVKQMYDRIRIPALHFGGWYDIFNEGTLDNFTHLQQLHPEGEQAEQRLLVGPWWHVPYGRTIGQIDFGSDAGGVVDRAIVRFLRRHLDPDTVPVETEPPVRYFVLFADTWKDAAAWPPPGSVTERWYLHSDGGANSRSGDGYLSQDEPGDEPADVYLYDPSSPVPSIGGHSCCFEGQAPMGAYDQSKLEDRMDVLVYTSPPLASDLMLAGPVRLHLALVTDAADADYVGKLCVVSGETAINISDRGYRATAEIRAGRPGEPVTLEFDLRNVAALVRAGQRLRLEVTSGSFPMYDINPQSGVPATHASHRDYVPANHAVLHDPRHPSYLEVTVLPGN